MKKAIVAVLLALSMGTAPESRGAAPRFEKVSDHCYYLRLAPDGVNVGIVATDEGVLMIDPPSETELPAVLEALKRVSAKPVRWVVFSNPHSARSTGARPLAERGALLLGGARLYRLAQQMPDDRPSEAGSGAGKPLPSWLLYERQLELHPSGLEIRIAALEPKALTGADVTVFVPAEKVLFAGPLYEAGRYPEIDAGGNAAGWVDGLTQVVDSIPLLKPAIPARKPAVPAKEEPEKTLEEGVAVVPGRGEIANLQQVKDLLSTCVKLRADISRAVKGARTCQSFLSSPRAETYRIFENFDSYALRMCEEMRSLPR